MDLKKLGWERVDWMHLRWEKDKRRALMIAEMKLRVS